MQDDLYYWHLTSTGWLRGKPANQDGVLVIAVFHSPEKMYSTAYWEDEWVSPAKDRVEEARARFGRRPKRH